LTQVKLAKARCEGTTRSGAGCKREAMFGSPFCHGHNPDRAQEREAIARIGGRGGGGGGS